MSKPDPQTTELGPVYINKTHELIALTDYLASIVERLARGTSDEQLSREVSIRAGELRETLV